MRRVALVVFLTLLAHAGQAHDGLPEQIASLTTQIAAQPDRADLYLRRGDLYRNSREFAKARADIDKAATLDPHLMLVDLARAKLDGDAKRPRDAESAASRFLEQLPRHVEALLIRARARAQLGRRSQAVDDLTRALDIHPNPDVYIERARLLQTAPADLSEALRGLDDGMAHLGPIITLELEAVTIERHRRRYDDALKRIDQITARMSRKESWLARRGEILEEARRPADARVAYEAALNAASALPADVRSTRATSTLISQIQTSLTRLASLAPTLGARRSGL